MNSEELEQSLRTEFESYLKNVLADMRQEVSEFQKQFEAEFEKHKAQLDEVFHSFSARVAADREQVEVSGLRAANPPARCWGRGRGRVRSVAAT